MLTTAQGFKKPESTDPRNTLRTSIATNADLSDANLSRWIPIAQRAGVLDASLSTSLGILPNVAGGTVVTTTASMGVQILANALFGHVPPGGLLLVRYRVVAMLFVNAVSPGTTTVTVCATGANYTVGTSGNASSVTADTGSQSGASSQASPAASTTYDLAGAEFANPAVGNSDLALAVKASTAIAANSKIDVVAQLQMRLIHS